MQLDKQKKLLLFEIAEAIKIFRPFIYFLDFYQDEKYILQNVIRVKNCNCLLNCCVILDFSFAEKKSENCLFSLARQKYWHRKLYPTTFHQLGEIIHHR